MKINLIVNFTIIILLNFIVLFSSKLEAGYSDDLSTNIEEIIAAASSVSSLVGTPADLGNISLSLINLKNQIKQMKDAADMFSGKNALKNIIATGGRLYRECGGQTYTFPLLIESKTYGLTCPFTQNDDELKKKAELMFAPSKNYEQERLSKVERDILRKNTKLETYDFIIKYIEAANIRADELKQNPDTSYEKTLEKILKNPNIIDLIALQTAVSIKLLHEQETTNKLLSSLNLLDISK